MKEKEIKEYFDQIFETMAPDLLDEICSQQREKIADEDELFGKDEPLFEDKKKKIVGGSVITAVAACFLAIILFAVPNVNLPQDNNVAFMIVIDVNPSISVKFNSEGQISDVIAGNKDAEKITENIKKKVSDETKYEDIMNIIIDEIHKQGYLNERKNSMLVTIVSGDSKKRKEVLSQVKNNTEKYVEESNKKIKTIYQGIKVNKEIRNVAKKNNVSIGKAALCIKLAKANNENYNKLCEKSISKLAADVEKNGIADDKIIYNGLLDSEELEVITDETQESIAVMEEETQTESEIISTEETDTEEISATETVESTKIDGTTTEPEMDNIITTSENK